MIYTMNGFTVKGGISMIKKTSSIAKIHNSDIFEFIDSDTGVHYLIYSHKVSYGGTGGITPRLNSDGTVMITE